MIASSAVSTILTSLQLLAFLVIDTLYHLASSGSLFLQKPQQGGPENSQDPRPDHREGEGGDGHRQQEGPHPERPPGSGPPPFGAFGPPIVVHLFDLVCILFNCAIGALSFKVGAAPGFNFSGNRPNHLATNEFDYDETEDDVDLEMTEHLNSGSYTPLHTRSEAESLRPLRKKNKRTKKSSKKSSRIAQGGKYDRADDSTADQSEGSASHVDLDNESESSVSDRRLEL